METVINFTEFRNRASDLFTAVEQGATLVITRHGRPIAEINPISSPQPAWKQPALRLAVQGGGLAGAIREERRN